MRLSFGECILDRERRDLTRRGSAVHTGPKLLALLDLLLDARPRALTKPDIHKRLWPDSFVSDATLTGLVAELRTAIGDDARAPTLVRTLHGYGYAFIGEVREDAPVPDLRLHDRTFRVILGDREIALSLGTHVLGRSADAAIFVDDVGVSRHHARITINMRGATIEDLESKNGTFVNGGAVKESTKLVDGSLIVLGTTTLKFRVFESSTTTDTVTPRVDE